MSGQRVQIKQVVSYGGHSVSAKGVVTVTFKAGYDELVKTIQLMQLLNNDILVKSRIPMRPVVKLGDFRVKSIFVDGDGQTTVKLSSTTDYVELDAVNGLAIQDADQPYFAVLYDGTVEDDGGDGE